MGLDFHDFKFMGLANTVAMEEFSASFDDDRQNAARLTLLDEYKRDGSPADKQLWLKARLGSVFCCLKSRPNWVESTPMWPFLNDQAMTFIEQVPVDENPVSSARLAPGTVLYLFGIRVPTDDGWEMSYRTIEQHLSLA